jgi:hypothetical protein
MENLRCLRNYQSCTSSTQTNCEEEDIPNPYYPVPLIHTRMVLGRLAYLRIFMSHDVTLVNVRLTDINSAHFLLSLASGKAPFNSCFH